MKDMMYDKGMVPPKGSRSAPSAKGTTRGASVKSGLSMQSEFHGESNESLGLCNRGKNQVPVHPKKKVSTDRGEFTSY